MDTQRVTRGGGTALTYTVVIPPAWWRRKYLRHHGVGKPGRPSSNARGQFQRPVDSLDRPVADEPISEPTTG